MSRRLGAAGTRIGPQPASSRQLRTQSGNERPSSRDFTYSRAGAEPANTRPMMKAPRRPTEQFRRRAISRVSARSHWMTSILTSGEGYHNFHHRFPSDYRNGLHWHDWDPSKWLIWSLSRLGLVRDLNRTPPSQILEARREAARGRLSSRDVLE